MSDVPASTRIAASTGPMHGAAQIANAPPSSTREPRLRAPCTSPAPTSRSGQGSRPMKANPKTTRTNPATRWSRNWLLRKPGADELGADAEGDEEGREAEHERNAREHDPPRRPALPEPVRLDGGDGREIARHERQHARGEERDEPRDQRDQRLGRPSSAQSSYRASSSSTRRSRSGSSSSLRRVVAAVAPAAPRPRERADDDDAEAERRERQEPGEQVEAALRRLGEHGRAELVDEASP